MVIDVVCDACGSACGADPHLLGEAVECPACGQVFTAHDTALAVGYTARPAASEPPAVPDAAEVYDPRVAARRPPPGPLAVSLLAWADRSGVGRPVGAAILVAGVLCVLGIVSPVPIRLAVLAMPIWAVAFLAVTWPPRGRRSSRPPAGWDGWSGRPRSDQDRRGTALARAGLIAGAGAVAAVWGVMVHGSSVFDWTAPAAHPLVATVVAAEPPVLLVVARPLPPAAAVAVPIPTAPATEPTRPLPVAVVPEQPQAVLLTAERTEVPATPVAPPADADAARSADEDVTAANLRAIHHALTDYVGPTARRYPAALAVLPHTAGLRAVMRSPFASAAVGPDASYALAAAGRPCRRPATADLAVIYDAAELARHGTTVGITAAGRLVYLDAEQVAAERATWAAD